MHTLTLTWSVLVLFVVQGILVFGRRAQRFEELPIDERCDWLMRTWEEMPTTARVAALYRGTLALACLGALHHLLAQLEVTPEPWALADVAARSSFQVGSTLLAVYIAGVAYLRVLQAHRVNHGLTLARTFLDRKLEEWRDRAERAFQERNRRDSALPDEGLRALMSRTVFGALGPYESVSFLEITVAEELILVESSRFDARKQSLFLAIDADYAPRLELDRGEIHRFNYENLATVDLRVDDNEGVGTGADEAQLVLTLLDGQVRQFEVDPHPTGLIVDCIRERIRRVQPLTPSVPLRLVSPGADSDTAARVECPECAEWIMPRARRCQFCGCDQLQKVPA